MSYAGDVGPVEVSSRTSWIPGGHLGIEATVWKMRRLVARSLGAPLLLEAARNMVPGSGDSTEAALRIRAYLEDAVAFVPDPLGVELLKSPVYLLREIEARGRATGDCDDVAVLGAALGRAIGLPARFVLLAFTEGAPYEHVYTELGAGGEWVELDTTRPAQLPSGLEVVRTGIREA